MLPISKLLRYPEDLFFRRVDERIYALVRMAFAVVALLNLISLWPHRHAFFSDAGLVDADVAIRLARPAFFSVFAFARSEAAVTGVMLSAVLCLMMLFAGIGARFAVFGVLVWHISYIVRSPFPLGGWDVILRNFSFLMLISPLGSCWTWPALKRGCGSIIPAAVSRHGLILMRFQVVVIYWHAVVARLLSPDPYWKNGEFLTYFLLSHHARWPGKWVLEHGTLLAMGTHAIQFAEFGIPILLWVKRTRWWGALLGVAVHAGICLFAWDFGIFGLAMMMTYLAFLRNEDVEALQRWWKRWARTGKNGPM